MKILIPIFSSLLFFSCKNTVPDAEIIIDTSTSKELVTITEKKVVCKNQFFKFVEVGTKKAAVLIQINEIEEMFRGKDSVEKYLEIIAFEPSSKPLEKKLWTKKFRADEAHFKPRYLHLVRNPRGEHEDLSIFIDYFTGSELVSFTGPNAFFAIPNQEQKRIVGFLSRANDLDLLESFGDDIIGTLTYASATEKLQTIYFRMKNKSLESSIQKFTPGMMIKTNGEEDKVLDDGRTVLLGSLRDGFVAEKITNIQIELIFYLSKEQKETSIIIPIIKDKMDLKNAIYDKNIFTLEN